MALATIAGNQLTTALKPQLALLVDDMRTRLTADSAELERWRATHQAAVQEKRTAVSWTDWSEDQLTQAAVGWLLTSVFVRFCEDNLLLGDTAVWITHPDSMLRQRAVDAETSFYREHPDYSYREWLEESFEALRKYPATQSLVDGHAALNITTPSSDAVHQLLAFWRRTDDNGDLVWTFRNDQLSTRFLGDLYQDLSDFAKKKYALLQTPEFVEEFILDQTMEPALKDRPLEGFKIIDPTCGSGHFLLGAFARLVERWHHHAPGLELRTRVDNALASIYGVDLNPFAVAIAKFRLIVAALQACGETSLAAAPKFTLNLANGDSLLHGPTEIDGKIAINYENLAFDKDTVVSGFSYSTEDATALRRFLAPGQYDAVVGNPPYVSVKDRVLRLRYREIYQHTTGKYNLTAPFMEQFFALAKRETQAGWVGQITSNSFMKREFGIPLVENFLSRLDLISVIDTSGIPIAGHGTPTVILIGKNRRTTRITIRATLSIQGENSILANPEEGNVWKSIKQNVHNPGFENQWISVVDLPIENLRTHPWSLSGGSAIEVKAAIDSAAENLLGDQTARVGFFGVTGMDAAMLFPSGFAKRHDLESALVKQLIDGDDVRDYQATSKQVVWFPYSKDHDLIKLSDSDHWWRKLWPTRTELKKRVSFSGRTYAEDDRPWYEWHQIPKDSSAYSITFADVETHNHFTFDRNQKTFNRHAPVIKLKNQDSDSYLSILGCLNSSIACFWLREESFCKRTTGESWEQYYDFNCTTVEGFPLPDNLPLNRATHLDSLSRELTTQSPSAIIESNGPGHSTFNAARNKHAQIRALMISEQEELDWEVYQRYGLIEDALYFTPGESPEIKLGERAFEIALARKMDAGLVESSWFERHGTLPITDLPNHWPPDYRSLVEARLEMIESNRFIRLLERPEYKRRWAGDSWDKKLQNSIKEWILDKLEDPNIWLTAQGAPRPLSVDEVAGQVEKNNEFIEALDIYAGKRDSPVTATLLEILSTESVPYLAALRYTDSGLRKRAEWERAWKLQRDEDAKLIDVIDIPVPPKYSSSDFHQKSYWSNRGKLDLPKERFISYPGTSRGSNTTPLLGWAGWNHAQQGIALAIIFDYNNETDRVPLVAGIAEVLPWVKQWHTGVDPTFGIDLAEYLTGQLHEKASAVGIPVGDLSAWRPAKTTRARKAAPRKAAQ